MDLLSSNPGTITRVEVDNARGQAVILTVGDGSSKLGSFEDGIIVTNVVYGQSANVQFMQTLRDAIYVYAFGDRIGDLQITGICVPFICTEAGANNTSGIKSILDYYSANRYSALLKPINVVFADETITGFLVGCQLSTMNAASFIHQFTLLMKALPPKGSLNYPGFSSDTSNDSDIEINWRESESIDHSLLG